MNTIESIVLRELRQLPPSQQNEVLDFVQFLRRKSPNIPKKSVRGLCADLPFNLTEQDMTEAGQEMWGNLGMVNSYCSRMVSANGERVREFSD
jgi:hypothetical protein